jgi:large subunit ribosomal protein L23
MGIFKRFKKEKTVKDAQGQKPSEQKAKVSVATGSKKKFGGDVTNVIVEPLISEKAATLSSASQYVFVVRKDANRVQVRSAIQAMYGVAPLSVNVMNVPGKMVRFGRREGSRSDWKKAVITLPPGQTIQVHEGV